LLALSVVFLPKNIKIRSRVSKLKQAKGGTFFETRCIFSPLICCLCSWVQHTMTS